MDFRFINQDDPLLESVITLGKKNSQTLGLMPRDAYIQQARKKCIVVAFQNNSLAGYCMFRIVHTKHRIGITQVCVDSSYRRQGIARQLLNQIQSKYGLLFNGMLVSCREDYTDACALWNGFGFIRKKRVPSRSIKEKRHLLKFWYPFGRKDLFSVEEQSGLLRVALDLNILIKRHDRVAGSEEINQLFQDWLVDEVEYCYASETLNEIHRDRNHERTESILKFLSLFTELTCNATEPEQYVVQMIDLHPGSTENHHSDRKQVAECKVCGIEYFITCDGGLVTNRVAIYEKLGISVLRPEEFILHIDELKNRGLYEPIRLQGTRFEIKKAKSSEVTNVVSAFLKSDRGEKKADFQEKVLAVAAQPRLGKVKIIKSSNDEWIATYGVLEEADLLTIAFIRVKPSGLLNTLFYQLLVESVRDAIRINKSAIKLTETQLTPEWEQILADNGFEKREEYWIKLAIADIGPYETMVACHNLSDTKSMLADDVALIESHPDGEIRDQLKLNLERKLWPMKFEDLALPVFIVPIKPLWAAQLFDFISANSSLFGAPPELSWSRENVYYRSIQPNVESAPGRILWYASQEKGFNRQKAIVGCSYLNNVVTGEPKVLYSTFRRFGVYTWKEIFSLAKGDIHRKIKVLQFSDTEVFERPVSLTETNDILEAEGLKRQTFVSPVKVNHQVFSKIYRLAR